VTAAGPSDKFTQAAHPGSLERRKLISMKKSKSKISKKYFVLGGLIVLGLVAITLFSLYSGDIDHCMDQGAAMITTPKCAASTNPMLKSFVISLSGDKVSFWDPCSPNSTAILISAEVKISNGCFCPDFLKIIGKIRHSEMEKMCKNQFGTFN
jgi:hypothetical protein